MHDLRQRHCPISKSTHCKKEWLLRGSLITLMKIDHNWQSSGF